MRNTVKLILAGLLSACTVMAQTDAAGSESVEGILNELGGYTSGAKAPVAAPAVAAEPAAEVPAAVEAPAAEVPAAVEAPAAEVPAAPAVVEPAAVEAVPAQEATVEQIAAEVTSEEIDAMVEESRDAYAGGEFERAQRGFEQIVKLDPENIIARLYLRKLIERDARTAEVSGMKGVSDAWDTSVVLRSYSISPEAAEKMELTATEGSMDIQAKFPEVTFPRGTSAIYQPKMEKLFVRNTRENLAVLEEILMAMDVDKVSTDVEQVEIEAKFVEVSEGTLEALGFEWRSTGGYPGSIHTTLEGGDVTIPNGQYLFDDALRGGPDNVQNPNLPFDQPDTLGAGSTGAYTASDRVRLLDDWTAFRFEDTFSSTMDTVTIQHSGHNPLDIILSALDQSTGADVLSAPRVVTTSGKKATIRVGQLHNFPEIYEVGGSAGNIVHVKYEDWEERLLGVELSVTPQVDAEQIELALNPKVVELQGWQTYDVAPADSAYTWNTYRLGFKFEHDAIQARLPIFRKREINTEVTIANGATIGMGGLINERVEAFEDKVPVLGSLPLVGRLFRNEGERAVKRNLLMFVTAKKVEPSGRISTDRSFE